MKSPFKFLDAFTLQDKDAFFGRDQEVDALYSLTFKTPMILVYGLSGTGKTSLVQCGLASRFDGPDWYPIFIRRNDNINTSINGIMRHVLGAQVTDHLADNVSVLLRKTLRPVYLVFDQLEELFILGKEEEQTTFMHSIRAVLDAQLPVKIIIIMREEYIGQLYHFEKLIPELFDHRFRIEPMGPGKVKHVIKSSFEKFNIQLAEPQEELLDRMVENINDPRTGIMLPYLQVYLDILYRDKYRKKYGQAEQTGYPPLEITAGDIASIGKIDNVLERFLEDQARELQRDLSAKYKNVSPSLVQTVLDAFVSEEGTKRPVRYKLNGDQLVLTDAVSESITTIPAPILTDVLQRLQQDRILRSGDEYMEVAHDSLALIIDSRRSESQRQLQNIRKRLMNAFEEFQKTGTFLNHKQLASFDEYIPRLGLTTEVENFLAQCEQDVAKKAAEESERLQHQTKMAQQKKLARSRGIWLTIATCLAGLAAWMWYQSHTKANLLEGKTHDLKMALDMSDHQRDSIANIMVQVNQQFGRMDSITSGDLSYSELVKSVITLKSLVRKEKNDMNEMRANHVSVIRMFPTKEMKKDIGSCTEDTVFRSSRIYLALHLNMPKLREWIHIKWLTDNGMVIGDPFYLEIIRDNDTTIWVSATTVLKEPGLYRAEVYNSLGVEIGRTKFTIEHAAPDEVSMTADSEFRTMASGSVTDPGPLKSSFKVGEMIHYWFRINSPKAGEQIFVELVDSQHKRVWIDDFISVLNTDKGFRVYSYRGAKAPGSYQIRLLNSKREELASQAVTIE